MLHLTLVDCCPVPAGLLPLVQGIKAHVPGATLQSCYRAVDARALLAKCGKHDQKWLFDNQGTAAQPNPANPPGRSTHELRSDGAAYRGPLGRKLEEWECGMDWDDAHIGQIISYCKSQGWVVVRPYPNSTREYHHLNVMVKPRFAPAALKRGDRGGRVWLASHNLAVAHRSGHSYSYLSHSGVFFSKHMEDAVKTFQREHHLAVDGQIGPQTWANIAAAARTTRQEKKKR